MGQQAFVSCSCLVQLLLDDYNTKTVMTESNHIISESNSKRGILQLTGLGEGRALCCHSCLKCVFFLLPMRMTVLGYWARIR